jgi:hypothetical protein
VNVGRWKKRRPFACAFWRQRLSLISLVKRNDSFITFLCVPVFICASGFAGLGFQLIRVHSRFTD